ncbi:MAG TPA: EipA family protein [Caulobacteraceae bacterium]
MDRRTLIAGAATAAAWAAVARAQSSDGAVRSEPLAPAGPRQDGVLSQRVPVDGDHAPADDAPPPAPPPPARADGPAEPEAPPAPEVRPSYPANTAAQTYDRNEVVNGASDFLGVSAESAAAAVERIFKDNGRPTAYIAGEEGSAAFFGGVRYGRGLLYMKGHQPLQVYWQGPSIGFDWGGNASRSFTLCYNLQYPDMIFRRFPGVEGTAYLIAGLGVNYQRADGITLAPIRTGLGLRLGANLGYLAYSRKRHIIPL